MAATTPYGELIDAGDIWSISAPHLPEAVTAAGLGAWWLHLLLVIDQAPWRPAGSAGGLGGVEAVAAGPGTGADDVVRACLDAIPVGLDQVATLDDRRDLHRLDLTRMRHSRQAKNLINAAHWHLDEIPDEGLADQLRE